MQATISPEKRLSFSGTQLKLFACAAMLLDHTGAALLEGPLQSDSTLLANLLLRGIGRLAFPIYLFLLVEGFCRTNHLKQYFLRLGLLCLMSELPFNLAFWGRPFYPYHQNVYFTLLLALAALCCCSRANRCTALLPKLLAVAQVAALAWLAYRLYTDYDAFGVLAAVLLYQLRNDPKLQRLFGALIFSWEITAPFAFFLISRYNGSRGKCTKTMQWCFYLFYPVHLLILACIRSAF